MSTKTITTINKMNILILGAKGNLGSQFIELLEKNKVQGIEHDDLDFKDLHNSLATKIPNDIDVIINCMAYNNVDACEKDKNEYIIAKSLNIELPKALALISKDNASLLIHFSSDYVFGAYAGNDLEMIKSNGGFSEEDRPRVNCKYADTKLRGEEEILKLDDLSYYIIRTSKLFGPKGDSSFAKPSFFDLMHDLSEKKDELKVVDDEMSCFTYTPELAKACMDMINAKEERGIYHIVNEGKATWHEGVKELFKITGSKTKLIAVGPEEFPRPAKRPSYSALKNTKLKKLRHYKEALKSYLNK